MDSLVIAIDGPAGAGKSTVAKLVAKQLQLTYLDTGAMYRALAFCARQAKVDMNDGDALAALLGETKIGFGPGDPPAVLLNGSDVSTDIRTPEMGELASKVSAHSPVRRAMVRLQQDLIAQGNVILEGRDATTVIAPNAEIKIFMTASLEERAKRRLREFETKGMGTDYDSVRSDIAQRDHRDISRDDSPLSVAADAVLLETAGLTIEQVVDRIVALAKAGS
jgi:cytidylate kinase